MTTITDAQTTDFAAAHEEAHPVEMKEFNRIHDALRTLAALIPADERVSAADAYDTVNSYIFDSLYPSAF